MAKQHTQLSADEAKAEILRLLGAGKSVTDAVKTADKSIKTYEYYRKTDDSFRLAVDKIRTKVAHGKVDIARKEVPDFPEFCEKYLNIKLWNHQLQWFDLLEGREPRNLHPSMTYEPGSSTRLIVNTPPGHAKSTTITVSYVLWRLMKNPDLKAIVISKSAGMAEKFLLQMRERLTNPEYQLLQDDFAPAGGWKEGSASWKANQFYIGGRSAEAKDPTVQAIGIRGQVYGARADLIIVDDGIDNNNSGEYDKQIDWLLGIVGSRLAPRTGRLLVIGTRIASKDMYSELRDPSRYYGGKQPWTYLLQPAVLEFHEDPADWVTLWPYADNAADPDDIPLDNGLYRRFDGYTLQMIRDESPPSVWSRIYQQEQFAEENIFKSELVVSACQMRHPGLIPNDPHIGRDGGMDGLYIVAGMDPASVGHTAAVVMGLDVYTGERYVIDIHNESSMSPDAIKTLLYDWTAKYNIKEWRVERNAFQAFLTRDAEIIANLANLGAVMREHYTGDNKHDPNFGVMAMAGLFEAGLIKLPNSSSNVIKTAIGQLTVWQPNPPRGTKTDIVMALWFAELRAQELVYRRSSGRMFQNTQFTTLGGKRSRYIVPMNEGLAPRAHNTHPAFWRGYN